MSSCRTHPCERIELATFAFTEPGRGGFQPWLPFGPPLQLCIHVNIYIYLYIYIYIYIYAYVYIYVCMLPFMRGGGLCRLLRNCSCTPFYGTENLNVTTHEPSGTEADQQLECHVRTGSSASRTLGTFLKSYKSSSRKVGIIFISPSPMSGIFKLLHCRSIGVSGTATNQRY